MLEGEITFNGLAQLDLPVGSATSVIFGPVNIVDTTIDFTSIAVSGATFSDFTFGAPGTLGPLSVTPLVTIAGGWSFEVDTLVINEIPGAQRNIQTSGTVFGPGFDPTPAEWALSTSGTSTAVGFSSSLVARPVPEPSFAGAMAIFFTGLGLVRKRRS